MYKGIYLIKSNDIFLEIQPSCNGISNKTTRDIHGIGLDNKRS